MTEQEGRTLLRGRQPPEPDADDAVLDAQEQQAK